MNKQNKASSLKSPTDQKSTYHIEKTKSLVRTRHDYPPLTFGSRRLHYQYSAVLPTIHLTLVSILQGLALGVLLLGIPITNSHQINLLNFLLNEYFYVPYLASSLLILLIWKEFAQACVYSNWPLSSLQSGLIYLIAVPEILAFKAISVNNGYDPTITLTMLIGWLIGLSFVGIIGGWIRLNNNRLEEIQDYESEEIANEAFEIEIKEGRLYIILGISLLIGVIVYESLTNLKLINNISLINSIISWIIPLLILIIASFVFWLDMKGRKEFLAKVLKNSDLMVSDKEVIRYSPDIEEEPSEIQALSKEVKELHILIQTLVKEIEASPNVTLISDLQSFERANSSNANHSQRVLERIFYAFGMRIKKK